MSELVIAEKNDLVNIANEIRQLTGTDTRIKFTRNAN